MTRTVLTISLFVFFTFNRLVPVLAQDQPKPQKDTVNIDTDAKPTFYYNTEDDGSASGGKSTAVTIAIIAGAVIVVGAVAFFLLKKKK